MMTVVVEEHEKPLPVAFSGLVDVVLLDRVLLDRVLLNPDLVLGS